MLTHALPASAMAVPDTKNKVTARTAKLAVPRGRIRTQLQRPLDRSRRLLEAGDGSGLLNWNIRFVSEIHQLTKAATNADRECSSKMAEQREGELKTMRIVR